MQWKLDKWGDFFTFEKKFFRMDISATKLELIRLILDEQSQETLEQALEIVRQEMEKEAGYNLKKRRQKKVGKANG